MNDLSLLMEHVQYYSEINIFKDFISWQRCCISKSIFHESDFAIDSFGRTKVLFPSEGVDGQRESIGLFADSLGYVFGFIFHL